jgi:hypothetical protein
MRPMIQDEWLPYYSTGTLGHFDDSNPYCFYLEGGLCMMYRLLYKVKKKGEIYKGVCWGFDYSKGI